MHVCKQVYQNKSILIHLQFSKTFYEYHMMSNWTKIVSKESKICVIYFAAHHRITKKPVLQWQNVAEPPHLWWYDNKTCRLMTREPRDKNTVLKIECERCLDTLFKSTIPIYVRWCSADVSCTVFSYLQEHRYHKAKTCTVLLVNGCIC